TGGGGFRGPGGGGRVSMADPPGGPGFFVSRVMDDPERTSILYDPRLERLAATEFDRYGAGYGTRSVPATSYCSYEEEDDVIRPASSVLFAQAETLAAGDKDGKDKGIVFPGKGLPGK